MKEPPRAPSRVLVTGNAGSGKTTLAAQLGAILGLPVRGLDRIVWQSGWRKTPQPEKEAAIRALAAEPAWVIDGVSPLVEERAELVVFLDAPPALCTWRCAQRSWRYLLRSRPGLPEGCPELLIIPALLRLLWRFDRAVRPGILARGGDPRRRFARITSGPERDALLAELNGSPRARKTPPQVRKSRPQVRNSPPGA